MPRDQRNLVRRRWSPTKWKSIQVSFDVWEFDRKKFNSGNGNTLLPWNLYLYIFWEFCRKFVLGTYNWRTFDDVAIEANIIGQGFKNLGVKAKDRIAILAETRAEWVTNIYIINFIFFKKYIYFFSDDHCLCLFQE